jgi:hypothetical protein
MTKRRERVIIALTCVAGATALYFSPFKVEMDERPTKAMSSEQR